MKKEEIMIDTKKTGNWYAFARRFSQNNFEEKVHYTSNCRLQRKHRKNIILERAHNTNCFLTKMGLISLFYRNEMITFVDTIETGAYLKHLLVLTFVTWKTMLRDATLWFVHPSTKVRYAQCIMCTFLNINIWYWIWTRNSEINQE